MEKKSKRKCYKKLPPVPKAGDGSAEGAVLQMIKDIHREGGSALSDGYIPSPGMITTLPPILVRMRHGKVVYRTVGKGGADLDRPAWAVEYERKIQNYHSEGNKVKRSVNFTSVVIPLGRQKHIENGQRRKQEVIKLYNEGVLKHIIAKKVGVSLRRVNQILKENGKY